MSNHLKGQTSPYLLQHAENPIYWYPWCEEAFEKARQEDKPVFLSIGYSTCHWCHVMARESFEDVQTAEILNHDFVSVKVDREERPDIDSVYMNVCQMLTGSGGWPMSIFMTAEQKPFFAGTYFPPEPRFGTPGFPELLRAIAGQWKSNRAELINSAEKILSHLRRQEESVDSKMRQDLPKAAADIFSKTYDAKYGGFGQAPKFPTPHNLIFLLLYGWLKNDQDALKQAETTLEKMRRGGIFDQIGYGFSRYSTDPYYLAPHFEKMLYDNALLIAAYSVAYKASNRPVFLETAKKTAEYIFREMTGSQGEFYSAQDADSDGEEGKYYVWSKEEIYKVLGKDKAEPFCRHFGVTEKGNFEGRNILNLLDGKEIDEGFDEEKQILYHYRRTRAKLHLDDKVLTAWNALMICAMAMLYHVTGNRRYLLAAEQASRFIEEHLASGDILYVGCRENVRSVKGFLDEYAYYCMALIGLYETTSKPAYLARAEQICSAAAKQFGDEKGGFFLSGTQNSSLILRLKESYDGALPSGNSVMAYCLVRLSQFKPDGTAEGYASPEGRADTLKDSYKTWAERQLAFVAQEAGRYPAGYCMFLIAQLLNDHPPQKITVVLPREEPAERVISHLPLYADITFCGEDGSHALLNGRTTYYVCRDRTCFPPVNDF